MATEHGFLSGGVRDGLVKLWGWDYQLYPVDAGEQNEIQLDGGIRWVERGQCCGGG